MSNDTFINSYSQVTYSQVTYNEYSGRSLHIEREEEDRPRRPQRRGLGLIETKKSSTKPVASKKKQTSLFVYQDGSEDNPNPAGLTGDWISDTIPKNRNLKGKENRDYATAWSEPR